MYPSECNEENLHFFNDPSTTQIYTLSLHDALPILDVKTRFSLGNSVSTQTGWPGARARASRMRSEEHTSELQSRQYLVCRLLLEKKKQMYPSECNEENHHYQH